MADSPSSNAPLESYPNSENPVSLSDQPELTSTSNPSPPASQPLSSAPTSTSIAASPNLPPPPPPPPSLSFTPTPVSGAIAVPPTAPSFRPIPFSAPQFSPVPIPGLPHPNFPNPGVPPPGVSSAAVGSVPQHILQYQVPLGQPPNQNPMLRPYVAVPNGYGPMPTGIPQGAVPPPGVHRFSYPALLRAPFPPRPPGAIGMVPAMSRPPVPGIPGIRPIIPPVIRPAILPSVTPAENPQTTVYIGRIAKTVENDFMLSLLQFCGPVKSWKRAQDPTDGTPRTFGFCEFESAEGVLRALRLLTKFNIDGQELALKGTQATRTYLKHYVEKKTENSKKLKETQDAEAKEEERGAGSEKNEPSKSPAENSKEENDSGEQEDHDIAHSAIVTDEDREADKEALAKLTSAIEERLKTKPLPPPPPPPPQAAGDGFAYSNAEAPAKSRNGDSDADLMKNDAIDNKNDDETTSDNKQTSEHDKPETSSPDRSRRYDRRSRERDRERDLKREKERELERYERETERERVRKEREQKRKIEEAERQYEECLKEWEYREREKEKQRQYEKEREKERERKRKKEIIYEEDDEEEDSRKRYRRSVLEEKRKKRQREKEDDLADGLKEEDEIAEANTKADEEQQHKQQRDALKLLPGQVNNINEKNGSAEEYAVDIEDIVVEQVYEGDYDHENHNVTGEGALQNGSGDESSLASISASNAQQSGNAPTKRLGFGLVGSGKRTTVPSVFHEEEDDYAQKEKKMRPLVPIDYSVEELQAVQPTVSGAPPPNLAAAAEFAKRISNANPREEKPDSEKERGRRSSDKSSQRDRDRNDEDIHRTKDANRSNDREPWLDKVKTPDNKKLLDAKQLIDMIPKTKEELFSYEINWAIYDKHELHERMRPWISKKITEFLGEEEATLVDYIVSSTQEHVKASQMLELLQSILDEEAEMFVLKMWRMLIFEIKKIETGLALRSRT